MVEKTALCFSVLYKICFKVPSLCLVTYCITFKLFILAFQAKQNSTVSPTALFLFHFTPTIFLPSLTPNFSSCVFFVYFSLSCDSFLRCYVYFVFVLVCTIVIIQIPVYCTIFWVGICLLGSHTHMLYHK